MALVFEDDVELVDNFWDKFETVLEDLKNEA